MDTDKAYNVLLYILNSLGGKVGMHKLFKILYFAEIEHLADYGRTITEDTFIKMENGPVPSKIYDHIKRVKNLRHLRFLNTSNFFDVDGSYHVVAKLDADIDELSETDIECLNKSITVNKDLNFGELRDKSHGVAWSDSVMNKPMSFEALAKEAGLNEEQLNYALESR